MRYLSFILFLFAFEGVKNTDMVCNRGKSFHIVKIGEGDSYSFKTQAQTRATPRKAPRTRCVMMYRKNPSCLEMRFHCSKFNVKNRRTNCRGLDRIEIMTPTKHEDFCSQNGPDVTTSDKFLKVTYLSKNKKQSSGEVCNMACVLRLPTPTFVEATTEGFFTKLGSREDLGVASCKMVNGICHQPLLPILAPVLDNSCNTGSDCWKPGKRCHEIMDVGCICKKGQCKIASGCGTMGAFFFRNCTGCRPDGCEDEGACLLVDGKCQKKPKLTSSKPTFAMPTLPPVDMSCNTGADCHKVGKICHQIIDVGCVCKQGQCKISSGCGTHPQGAFFYQNCTGCSPDGCEDEGACILKDGVCQDTLKSTPPKPTPTKPKPSKKTSSKPTSLAPIYEPSLPAVDNSCNTGADCYKAGKICHQIFNVGCVCKQGQCKIGSVGFGTWGFGYQNCTGFSPDKCTDEGACVLVNGKCQEIPDEITGPLENPELVQSNYCNTMEDCQMYGMCGIMGDTKCVCKKGRCENSSGCGTWEDSLFRNCTGCTPEGCEDEGVCWLEDGECRGPNNPCKTWIECDAISQNLFQHGKKRRMTP